MKKNTLKMTKTRYQSGIKEAAKTFVENEIEKKN